MKKIFDEIRAIFAHQKRDFGLDFPVYAALYNFQRSVRGFSNRLEHLTSTAARSLKAEDSHLNTKLNDSLFLLIRRLSRHTLHQEFDSISALKVKDTSGRIKAVFLDKLRKTGGTIENMNCIAQDLTVEGDTLKIQWVLTARLSGIGNGIPYKCESVIKGYPLDTLHNAAMAYNVFMDIREQLHCVGSTHPAYQEALKLGQQVQASAEARDTRIRSVFSTLTASDREFVKDLLPWNSKLLRYLA